jgi:hypothetical protein
VRHVEVLEIDQTAWSLLILGDPDPYPPLTTPDPSPHQIGEEPL